MLGFLQAVESFLAQYQDILIACAAVFLVAVFAIWVSQSRKRYVVLRASTETELLAHQLGRIASALENLAASPRASIELAPETKPEREAAAPAAARQAGVGSMFGFGRRVKIPNPLYQPK